MVDGTRANKAGQTGEAAVASILETYCGYVCVPCKEFRFGCTKRSYATQCMTDMEVLDVYGRRSRLDFALSATERWPKGLAIEVKWQTSGGSVDQKFPYVVMSAAESPVPLVVVADGGGASAEAIAWLRKQAGSNNIVAVCTLGEFARFARDELQH